MSPSDLSLMAIQGGAYSPQMDGSLNYCWPVKHVSESMFGLESK